MDTLPLSLNPACVDAGPTDEPTLNELRRLWPSRYGQPSECCGDPARCAAACGDQIEVPDVG